MTHDGEDRGDRIEVEVEGVRVDADIEGSEAAGAEAEGAGSKEEYHVRGEDLLSRVKQIVREGNVRRITIRSEGGSTLIEIPLAIGVVGAMLMPVWAAVGAIAALVANCTIQVERRVD